MPELGKKRVLFICTHNSARSQMAEGLLRHLAGDRFDVYSAGTQPSAVNPLAVKVMAEGGIDISKHRSKSLAEFIGQAFDAVITVCDSAKESCPVFPGGTQRIHWSLPDPSAAEGSEMDRLLIFREVRNALHQRLRQFLAALP